MKELTWLDQYKNKDGVIIYSHEIILADVLMQLIETLRSLKVKKQ